MKAILVMEMPENCAECPLEIGVEDTSGREWEGNICRGCGKRNANSSGKPDWCPLVTMPECDVSGVANEYNAATREDCWQQLIDRFERVR